MYKSIIIVLLTAFLFSCETEFFTACLKGEGDIITREIIITETIHGIEFVPEVDVLLKSGEAQFISITGHENIIDAFESDSKVNDGIYKMDIDGCTSLPEIEMVVTIPNLEYMSIKGQANILTEGVYTSLGEELEIRVEGEGKLNLDLASLKLLKLQSKGITNVKYLKGLADHLDISISGESEINAFDFIANTASVDVRGVGDCQLSVNSSLDVKISGEANICYKGMPTISQSISGEGSVRSCN